MGSAFGLYVLDGPGGEIDWQGSALLHLAAVTRGVYYGSGGEFGICTAIDDVVADRAIDGLTSAIGDLAAAEVAQPA